MDFVEVRSLEEAFVKVQGKHLLAYGLVYGKRNRNLELFMIFSLDPSAPNTNIGATIIFLGRRNNVLLFH